MQKKDFPNRVTIELTNRCNISCTFCHRQVYDMKLGEMSPELFKKLIDEMAEHLPIKLVPFFRGEPLLHPQFIELMAYAKQKGIGPIQVFSNGLDFDEKISEAVIEAGVDFISFSLDTLDDEIYKNSRKYGDLQKSINNVKYLSNLCKKYKSLGKKVPQLQVSTVDLEVYREGQKDFVEFWKPFVDIIRIYEEHDENGGFVDPEVTKALSFLSERQPCRKLFTDMIIYWDGAAALCNYDWNHNVNIGNVSEKSISEVWNSEVYENLRSMHNSGNIDTNIMCSKCEHWKADYLENHYLGKAVKGTLYEE